MKYLVFISLLLVSLFSCKETPQNKPISNAPKEVVSDSIAIANTIHGFYKWYENYLADTSKHMDFLDNDGKHYILNQTKLERYYAPFMKSGFVRAEFIENEYAFYKKCNALWQDEPAEDVPSCVDGDKYYCAQDWETEFWTNAPVRIKMMSPDSAFATLYSTDKNVQLERNFELKKENGQWLLSKIECDMGVNF